MPWRNHMLAKTARLTMYLEDIEIIMANKHLTDSAKLLGIKHELEDFRKREAKEEQVHSA